VEIVARKVSKNLRRSALRGKKPFMKREGLIYGLQVVNIVAAHQLPHRIAIERIHELWRWRNMNGEDDDDPRLRLIKKSQYDPTIFPALRCKFHQGKATALVYISGKVILTGVREIPQMNELFNSFISLLSQFPR
jgi:TATA-box binding protein (TBP) (component of TFIID and TFIIIB)